MLPYTSPRPSPRYPRAERLVTKGFDSTQYGQPPGSWGGRQLLMFLYRQIHYGYSLRWNKLVP